MMMMIRTRMMMVRTIVYDPLEVIYPDARPGIVGIAFNGKSLCRFPFTMMKMKDHDDNDHDYGHDGHDGHEDHEDHEDHDDHDDQDDLDNVYPKIEFISYMEQSNYCSGGGPGPTQVLAFSSSLSLSSYSSSLLLSLVLSSYIY